MNNEFLLFDRIDKIKQIVDEYGIENFCISFSGGKDSTVLHYLVDMALPNNKIPRVYADTGIELNIIKDFVKDLQKHDDRIVIIKPSTPIREMLERDGYPFKSKDFAQKLKIFRHNDFDISKRIGLQKYLDGHGRFRCPNILRYMFDGDIGLNISDKCCTNLKEKPLHKWQEENDKPYCIIGLMRDEGGRRVTAKCLAFKDNGRMNFQPLVVISKEWEDWFIEKYNIKICDIYYEPYNFPRTGCKGCPFTVDLQRQLDILEEFFPDERKQCEIIWKPVYDEYRRIGYRLKSN